ncbi:hypothetical protein [Pedobacter sp. NJ-S-72]
MLALTTVPCCALEKVDSDSHQVSPKAEEHKCAENDDNCCKDCSPFYVCGTCVGFTINSNLAPTFTVYLRSVKHESVYLTVELPQILSVIWQPPKLS